MAQRVKVNVITGFLGSGKTTFLRQAIQEISPPEKVAVLLNEYGEISIDGIMLQDEPLKVWDIPQGCICCSMRGDLVRGTQEVIKTYQPDRLLIEPTGLASPSEVIEVLQTSFSDQQLVIMPTIGLINAHKYRQIERAMPTILKNCITEAKVVILNNADQVGSEELETIHREIKEYNTLARTYITSYAQVPFKEVLNIGEQTVPEKRGKVQAPADKELKGIDSVSLEFAGTFDRQQVLDFFHQLKGPSYGEVLRAKGVFVCSDGCWNIDYVLGDVRAKSIDTAIELSGIVIIGKDLQRDVLGQLIKECQR